MHAKRDEFSDFFDIAIIKLSEICKILCIFVNF